MVSLLNLMDATTSRRSFLISTMPADSMATSVPAPWQFQHWIVSAPAHHWCRHHHCHNFYLQLQFLYLICLVLRKHFCKHTVDSNLFAMAEAVRLLSPVIITTSIPISCSLSTASLEFSLRVSATAQCLWLLYPLRSAWQSCHRFPFFSMDAFQVGKHLFHYQPWVCVCPAVFAYRQILPQHRDLLWP